MKNIKTFFAHKIFRVFMWVILVLLGAFIILTIVRTFHYFDVQKTDNQVLKIHSTKLTMDDVMGKNLPPDPGIDADKTVQGIDANNNGIRDDVELAVFKEYPKSAKTRAVLLQYALALQMETVQPFINTTIATEVITEQSRAYVCIGDIFSKKDLKKFGEETDILTNFIKERMFNTEERKNYRNLFVEEVRSFSGSEQNCDIDLLKLSN
jgi:hypothetical protein